MIPQMGVQPIPVEPVPLPLGTLGLILGRASLTLQGLMVMPGIVDTQHSPELQILASSPAGAFSIAKGDRIAQLLLLPGAESLPNQEYNQIGSTGSDSAYLMISLNERPKLSLKIQGKRFEGILDTGADKSIISKHWWPQAWPVTKSAHSLQGLGYQSSPTISSASLTWEAPDGKRGLFTPYVLPLPVNLWGRDILQDMGFALSNDHMPASYSQQSQAMMNKMGHELGTGLGKFNQGRVEPLSPRVKQDKKGLGFF